MNAELSLMVKRPRASVTASASGVLSTAPSYRLAARTFRRRLGTETHLPVSLNPSTVPDTVSGGVTTYLNPPTSVARSPLGFVTTTSTGFFCEAGGAVAAIKVGVTEVTAAVCPPRATVAPDSNPVP